MVPPEKWVNYETVFGVSVGWRHYDYDAFMVRSSVPAGVLWPGEQPRVTIRVVNHTGGRLQRVGRLSVIRYGTRGRLNDIWRPSVVGLDSSIATVSVDVPAGGYVDVGVCPFIPALFGGYALVMDLGPYGRRLVTSLVRTFRADARRLQFPKQSLDDMGAGFLHRVGVQAIRMSVDYTPTTAPSYDSLMKALGRRLAEYRSKNITVLLMFGAGTAPMPLGISRPFLDSNGALLKTKQDFAWLPSADHDFREFVRRLCIQWGWPAGPVTAVSLWNEPWEGMSISGWQADIPRYREIYRAMADAVLLARREGARVLIGGGDSNSNAWDKLFADGKMTFLPVFDFCSIHYQGIESPALYPEWVHRRSPNGRVKIWDTESWVGNTDDRIGLVVATDRSAGYDRSMGIYAGYMRTGGPSDSAACTWSPAAAVGAVQHFIGERDFKELLFKGGLPWVMLFDGYRHDPDDGTAVVCGDIGQLFGRDHVLYRGVQLAHGTMTIPALPSFRLYDFYGNIIPPLHGKLMIPLNSQGYYLRGAHDRLIAALRNARIEGYSPVEIVARDMTARPPSVLSLQLRNVLNRPVQGRLSVELQGLAIHSWIRLRPHEARIIPVHVPGSSPDNRYHLSVRFDGGVDGVASHEEDMHVNLITRRHITVDGRLDDWEGVLPQQVRSSDSGGISLTETAWYPFKNFDTRSGGFATGYFAYDDRYFYFAAKVADSTPHPGTYRFANRPDSTFFYPDTAYDMQGSLETKEGNGYWENGEHSNSFGVDLVLPRPMQVAFYLPNIKVYGVAMECFDSTGRLLFDRRIDKLWNGVYEVCNLSGRVRVVFHSFGWWYTAKLGGVFFDTASGREGFVKEDFDTARVYGSLRLPPGVTLRPIQQNRLTPLVWPAGVRHFTYRKNPVTPDNSGLGYMFDNVLLAFNALPIGQDGMLANPPGTMPRYTGYKCTDYEYALNPVAPQYGGGTEIWRLLKPGLNRKHFFPRQPKSPGEGPVGDGKLVIRREGNTLITECALPWSEIPDVHKAMVEGRTVKLSFRVNDNGAPGACMELAKDRSVSKVNARAFHPDWKTHWANEVAFGFEKPAAAGATAAIQRWIDNCALRGGGVVRVTPGKYIIGTLFLKDNVELHLDSGAVLLGSTHLEDYTQPALIYAENATGVAITGKGAIDGRGGDPVFQKGDNGPGRPRLIYFVRCRDVRIKDVTLRNSPFWVQYYSGCDSVAIQGIKVYSHCNWNNDGLDIDSRHVTVSDCTIDSDDDALCLKSERPDTACAYVRVSHCRLASNCNAIKLGTASRGGFQHIFISDCTVRAASSDPIRHWKRRFYGISAERTVLAGIAIETVDGGATEDVNVSNIRMDDVQTPIFIRLGHRSGEGTLQDVTISHVVATARSLMTSSITGLPGAPVDIVRLNDITINGPGGGTDSQAHAPVPERGDGYPENRIFGYTLPASGLYVRHVRGLSISGLTLATALPDRRPPVVLTDVDTVTTLVPVVQSRDASYNWQSRHEAVLALNKTSPPVDVILGNSIVHYWGGMPAGPVSRGSDSWPQDARNLGFGWDRIENVLWRVLHGELDGYSAKNVLIMIGTNNLAVNTDDEIVAGLTHLVRVVRERQPRAAILLAGILPRRGMEARIARLNQQISRIPGVTYIDPGRHLLSADGKIEEALFVDGLHPNAEGYRKLGVILPLPKLL